METRLIVKLVGADGKEFNIGTQALMDLMHLETRYWVAAQQLANIDFEYFKAQIYEMLETGAKYYGCELKGVKVV
jgi:hypothetical protein